MHGCRKKHWRPPESTPFPSRDRAPRWSAAEYARSTSRFAKALDLYVCLRHTGYLQAADVIVDSMEEAISDKVVTYDFARLMQGAKQLSCPGFGQAMSERI
jgi:isocitrate dehydrogenase